MPDLPSGTLTFFFSDIEGSTRLLEALGDRYSPVLERYRALVRGTFGDRGGIEVGTQGDSFFAVFPDAPQAIVAAVAIQRAMAAEPWPEGAAPRIRIGLHTGQARVVAGDYVGLDVHRAARIMATGHGGEIVASEATCAGVEGDLGDGIELRDLGEHRLRDLSAPERLYQVIATGLVAEFPPLRTLDRTPNNLPTQPTILVGRDAELERIRRHLDGTRVRVLTLTGPGGIGKTRLALQAAANQADRFADGVYFVDLADAGDTDAALREIARTLGLAIRAGDNLRSAVSSQIGQRDLLLVLDNFEQVMSAADEVAELLRACPKLRVIVTSRESLHVRGEQLIEVAPLSFPDTTRERPTAAQLAGYEAVNLFLERAAEARPDFALTDENAHAVAGICARLDGLPLAIELAAARLRLFTVEELRDRLSAAAGLDVLRGGARDLPARQRTLRGTIAWSHDLLDDDERAVFGLMSVFASAQVESVEAVAKGISWLGDVEIVDVLASLVDKSLLRGMAGGRGRRLTMLETIREFAAERLADDPERASATREAHAAYFASVASTKAADLGGADRRTSLDELAAERDNLLVAWRWYVDRADVGHLHALLDALWPLDESRGWYHGALALLNDLLTVFATLPPAPWRTEKEITIRISAARALLAIRGYTDEVETLYGQAVALAESEGSIPRQLPVLRSLASFHLYRGEIEKTIVIGRKILRLAETDSDADPMMAMEGHLIVGPALAFMGQTAEGMAHLDQVLSLYDPDRYRSARFRLGPNPGVAAASVSALLAWQFGNPESADRRAELALAHAARVEHPYSLAYGTFHVGLLDLWAQRYPSARDRVAAVQAIAARKEYLIWTATGLVVDGVALALLGDPAAGLDRTTRGIALYQERPTPPVFWPQILALHGTAMALAGRLDEALEIIDQAAAITQAPSWDGAMVRFDRADILARRGDVAGATAAFREAMTIAGNVGARSTQLRAATRLAAVASDPADRTAARETIQAVLPTLTEGADTYVVRDARRALDPALTAAEA